MNVLDIAAIIIVAGMVILGIKKGFVAMVTGAFRLIICLIAAILLKPLGVKIINSTKLPESISDGINAFLEKNLGSTLGAMTDSAGLQEAIDGIPLPDTFKDGLVESIGGQGNAIITNAQQQISDKLTETAVGIIAFIGVLLAVTIIYTIICLLLKGVVSLPVLKQANEVLGAVGGAALGVLILGIAFTVLTLCVPYNEAIADVIAKSYIFDLYTKVGVLF